MSLSLTSISNTGRTTLTVSESKQVLAEYGFSVNKSKLVSSETDIVRECANLTFPLVMKIVSPQIVLVPDDLQLPQADHQPIWNS